jgi:broad specificity phosphatase PhoE
MFGIRLEGPLFTLIRHAEPSWADPDNGLTLNEPNLSERGRRQCTSLRKSGRLSSSYSYIVSTSPRASETFELAFPGVEQANRVDWLREIQYPASWEGAPRSEIVALLQSHDSESQVRRKAGHSGGESGAAFIGRVERGWVSTLAGIGVDPDGSTPGLWRVAESALDEKYLIVGHAGSLAVVLAVLMGIRPTTWIRQSLPLSHCSLTVVEPFRVGEATAFSLRLFNDVSYLPDGLRV